MDEDVPGHGQCQIGGLPRGLIQVLKSVPSHSLPKALFYRAVHAFEGIEPGIQRDVSLDPRQFLRQSLRMLIAIKVC